MTPIRRTRGRASRQAVLAGKMGGLGTERRLPAGRGDSRHSRAVANIYERSPEGPADHAAHHERRHNIEVSEVRIKLAEDRHPGDGKLLAYASISLDDAFVVRDLKVIAGSLGRFVAMPSRSLKDPCPHCGRNNPLRAWFCNQCGVRLAADRIDRNEAGRFKVHADVAHPITSECREMILDAVLAAYDAEVRRSELPGYVPMFEMSGPRNGGPLSARMVAAAKGRVA